MPQEVWTTKQTEDAKDAKERVFAFVFFASGEGLAERSALKSEHAHPKLILDKCNLVGYNVCVTG